MFVYVAMLGETSGSFAFPPMSRVQAEAQDPAWLEAFRRGDREVIEDCYRRYYDTVESAIGSLLGIADRETVIHEVFFRLLSEKEMRASFSGPSLGAWLASVARNRAVDLHRRARRESLVPSPLELAPQVPDAGAHDDRVMHLLIERFRREHLTPEWAPVFEARFVRQMTQREAARYLGIRRTTLAYRELQLRRRFKAFMLSAEEP
jgi:RNA polymerase sigma-70 factor (ECF subfamily)